MKKVKKASPIPLYGTALVWAVYCIAFPLYKPSHFILLLLLSAGVFILLTKLFPGRTITVDAPRETVSTGSAEGDKLYNEGQAAIAEMELLRSSIENPAVRAKIESLIHITQKIFDDIVQDPGDIPRVKKFAGYFLPATIKLLNSYQRMSTQGIDGENISSTLKRIEDILDTAISAFEKQLDALFADQALDIETDIDVLEAMLKREGLSNKDF